MYCGENETVVDVEFAVFAGLRLLYGWNPSSLNGTRGV
jgi:hypothetical protein